MRAGVYLAAQRTGADAGPDRTTRAPCAGSEQRQLRQADRGSAAYRPERTAAALGGFDRNAGEADRCADRLARAGSRTQSAVGGLDEAGTRGSRRRLASL